MIIYRQKYYSQKQDYSQEALGYKPGQMVAVDRVKLPGKKGPKVQHWGIVEDNAGHIIEYTSVGLDPRTSRVRRSTLEKMAHGDDLHFYDHSDKFTPEEVVDRARNEIGSYRGGYHLKDNNCEHFAREMATGERVSKQAEEGITGSVLKGMKDIGNATRSIKRDTRKSVKKQVKSGRKKANESLARSMANAVF